VKFPKNEPVEVHIFAANLAMRHTARHEEIGVLRRVADFVGVQPVRHEN
jgi:hypothetical protein